MPFTLSHAYCPHHWPAFQDNISYRCTRYRRDMPIYTVCFLRAVRSHSLIYGQHCCIKKLLFGLVFVRCGICSIALHCLSLCGNPSPVKSKHDKICTWVCIMWLIILALLIGNTTRFGWDSLTHHDFRSFAFQFSAIGTIRNRYLSNASRTANWQLYFGAAFSYG